MNTFSKLIIATAVAFASTSLAFAQPAEYGAHHHVAAVEQVAAAPAQVDNSVSGPLVNGEVKRVNLDTKEITLKHEALTNLGMPGMTMVFAVKDSAMLTQVKAGDQVKFIATDIAGTLTVVRLELVK